MRSDAGSALLLIIPFVSILVMAVLRLDEHVFAPGERRKDRAGRPRFANFDESDGSMADPDGRISRPKSH